MLSCLAVLATATAFVHPIVVENSHFVDSVTQKPFLIKGVDYQPGGSSGYVGNSDPLSNVETCARDIFLFQKLGVNTIRVYSVNPELDHDACMTMLAAAGIYLILDVNSPRVGESLNRYEPWTTYNPDYLRRIFQVTEQFSYYNNTLGFFMGNEIVNDERSASVSPAYIRAVTRDLKNYILYNSPRPIPVGYSAADDLRYRIPLADYLTCGEDESAVDFYGINSYQWCGEQTFQTSGYDLLVRDHEKFTVPFFLSEFGCNLVQPRLFHEIDMLFSPAMTHVFSGGLVYEFTQEPNNYGLVDIDAAGDAHLRLDFDTLRSKLENVTADSTVIPVLSQPKPRQNCKLFYPGFNPNIEEPPSFGTEMIRNGVRIKRGQLLTTMELPQCDFSVYTADGELILDRQIHQVVSFTDKSHSGEFEAFNTSMQPLSASHTVIETSSLEEEVATTRIVAPGVPTAKLKWLDSTKFLDKWRQNPQPHRLQSGELIKTPQVQSTKHKNEVRYESSGENPLKQSLTVIGLSVLVCFLMALNYQ